MQTNTVAAARILRFLEQEPVVWLSTVRPDGGPHLVPVWFWWDGAALLIFSKPEVRNMRADPRVMLALGDAEDDFDVGLIRGRAEIMERPTRAVLPVGHLAKYAAQLAAIGLSAEEYATSYSQVIRIVPDAFLGWHGRTVPQSARLAGAPAATLAEPRRAAIVGDLGEPIARRRRQVVPRIVPPVPPRPTLRGRLAHGLRGLADGLRAPVPQVVGAA
jgi:PPOX class probable F420-dependent enzyme